MSELKKLDLNQPTPQNTKNNTETPMPQTDENMSTTTAMPITRKTILVFSLIAIAGIATGFTVNSFFPRSSEGSSLSPISTTSSSDLNIGDVIGLEDEDTFSDTADGVVEKGGLNGEGSHKLLRPGGISQTVYLTSSAVDLDELTGHKVTVWGETFASQNAGWLMDVGRIEVLELNATNPE